MPGFNHVLSSTLDDDTIAWLTELLAVIESLDADAYAARMSGGVELRLPGGTVVNGPQAVADTLRGAWATTASLVHHDPSPRPGLSATPTDRSAPSATNLNLPLRSLHQDATRPVAQVDTAGSAPRAAPHALRRRLRLLPRQSRRLLRRPARRPRHSSTTLRAHR